ncbi:DUF4064 domain-containing protein [Staphylococcus equorum]|uniref:DUF4064 domain-containing protein n=1 Tax=Staphylococcus equorum TaxID=246432 RepID=UPI00203EB071|nr:DUF4064 domain-containing protein [Staphylococcus equorum]MCM3072786.1 DUF4064 domain-containing protein [Staphylococcus equorum]
MIKRTAEKVITWIGIGFQILTVLGISLLLFLMNMETVKESMIEDGAMTASEAASSSQLTNIFLIIGLVLSIVLLVLAILSAKWIDKKSKVAGVILIIIGVISLFGNWIATILWIVSGIMLLVKKPKTSLYNEREIKDDDPFSDHSNSTHKQNEVKEAYANRKEDVKKIDDDPYKY